MNPFRPFLIGLCLLPGAVSGQTEGRPPQSLLARSATVVLKVPGYAPAQAQVQQAAAAQGALLLDARTAVNEKGRRHGWMRFRVPSPALPALLAAVHGAGVLSSERLDTVDSRSEYEELARRAGRLREHEQRLSGVLQSDRRMRGGDILFLQERLFRASVDESLLGQQRIDLRRQAAASLLTVQLYEPGTLPVPDRPDGPRQRFAASLGIARAAWTAQTARAATGLAYAAVFAPLWIPALILALLVIAWLWRRRGRAVAFARRLQMGIQRKGDESI